MEYPTLFNEEIALFYKQSCNTKLQNTERFFDSANCLNFVEIVKYLREGNHELKFENYANFVYCYNKLLPLFTFISDTVELKHADELNLLWLGQCSQEITVYLKSTPESEIGTIECILILTAYLENALGNVYFTLSDKGPPPHLLKDLLDTAELQKLFGSELMLFMKILLGSPCSINLRNVVWHGFPTPTDIPLYYRNVLLISMHSIGCYLEKKKLKLKQRVLIQNFNVFTAKLECDLSTSVCDKSKEMAKVVPTVDWLSEPYKMYWQNLNTYYVNQNYWLFVIVILPQIELLMRILYGTANDYDISAKLDEYYITIGTIFEADVPTVPSKPNKLLTFKAGINESTFKCIYDLFVAPNGPRLRDKVCHGEVTLDAINDVKLCNILINIALQLMRESKCFYIPDDYESKFHLNAMTRSSLNEAKQSLIVFTKEHLPTSVNILSKFNHSMLLFHAKIFNRHKKEAEINLLIYKVAKLLISICSNFDSSIQIRTKLMEQRLLHSKRRATLHKLLTALPNIFGTLFNVLDCCIFIYLQLQQDNIVNEASTTDKMLSRFLKHSLKLTENCNKYSHKDRNEWIKAVEICEKYKITCSHLYPI